MEITTQKFKRASVVTVAGRIDSSTGPEFDQTLTSLREEGIKSIVVNMAGVDYLSSAGLRVLVATRKALKSLVPPAGDIVIAAPSEQVRKVLELAGLTSIFTIYPDTLTAVGNI